MQKLLNKQNFDCSNFNVLNKNFQVPLNFVNYKKSTNLETKKFEIFLEIFSKKILNLFNLKIDFSQFGFCFSFSSIHSYCLKEGKLFDRRENVKE